MKKLIAYISCFIVLTVLLIPVFVSADTPVTTVRTPIKFENPLKDGNTDLMSLIVTILNNIVMPIAAVGVVLYIVYAGFTYVMAQGNPTEIKKAHDRLLWALVGAGILLGAAGIAEVVKNTVEEVVNI